MPAGRGLEQRVSASALSPLPSRYRLLARLAPFAGTLRRLRSRACSLPRAPLGLRLRRRQGSRPACLLHRPPASRRHGCLPLPTQHGEVLRGRGWRSAPPAALRLLRHARLARLHGGEATGPQRLAAARREPDRERERGRGWALLGRGSLTGACGHSAEGGGDRGIRAEREQLELWGTAARWPVAPRALPCGERHLPPTGRGLSVPSRHPLLPTQPSGLPGGAECSCQQRGKGSLLVR